MFVPFCGIRKGSTLFQKGGPNIVHQNGHEPDPGLQFAFDVTE